MISSTSPITIYQYIVSMFIFIYVCALVPVADRDIDILFSPELLLGKEVTYLETRA
jgi:hypothetical protein